MAQDNPNAQSGDAAASHEKLAKGEKFEARHARCRAGKFWKFYFLRQSYTFTTNDDGLHRLFNRLGDRNLPNPQFDPFAATQICIDGTMRQEDPPARRAGASGGSTETPCGASYNVETDRMPDEHQLFSRRRIDSEVTVGLGVGRIVQRHGSTLVETGIPRSPIIDTPARLFFSMYSNSCMYGFVCMVLCTVLCGYLYFSIYISTQFYSHS